MATMQRRHSSIPPEAQAMFAAIASLPTLPKERQREMLFEYARTRDSKLEARIVEANLRFVTSIILQDWRNMSLRLPLADLVQEGSLGLLHALRKFEPERGLAFTTYAVWWIRARVRWAVKESLSPVKIDRNRIALSAIGLPISISTESPELMEKVLPAIEPPSAEELDQARRVERYEVLMKKRLSPRERTVLHFRARGMTLQALGDQFGLSRERVRQIERQAITKVKKGLREGTEAA